MIKHLTLGQKPLLPVQDTGRGCHHKQVLEGKHICSNFARELQHTNTSLLIEHMSTYKERDPP